MRPETLSIKLASSLERVRDGGRMTAGGECGGNACRIDDGSRQLVCADNQTLHFFSSHPHLDIASKVRAFGI